MDNLDTHFFVRLRGQFLGSITVKSTSPDEAALAVRAEIAKLIDLQIANPEWPAVEMHSLGTITSPN
jgi:hypothetical protein